MLQQPCWQNDKHAWIDTEGTSVTSNISWNIYLTVANVTMYQVQISRSVCGFIWLVFLVYSKPKKQQAITFSWLVLFSLRIWLIVDK